MSNVPEGPTKPVEDHEASIERVLDQLEAAARSDPPVRPDTFDAIASTLSGVVRYLVEDAKRLEERLSYVERH